VELEACPATGGWRYPRLRSVRRAAFRCLTPGSARTAATHTYTAAAAAAAASCTTRLMLAT